MTPHLPLNNYCITSGRKNVGLKHLISKVSIQGFFLIVVKRTVQTPVVSWIPVVCNVFEFNWLFIY